MPIKQWKINEVDETLAQNLSKQLNLSPLVARVLAGRGYHSPEKIEYFLHPKEQFSDPFTMKDMDKAVLRIRQAMERGERIAIYGDYDCDGIMSTVLLYSYLESAGADVCYYIPERDREGYGLNCEALGRIHQDGVSLVVTVDNGITALEEVAYAASIGLDVIITDHHQPRSQIPQAVAVINPHRADDESGCRYLAGVGVAFKLVCALEGDDGTMLLDHYADLVAIATVADIVPLFGENRIIVQRGLALLQDSTHEGIAALLRVCGLSDRMLTCENIAYGIVPRINSAGRFDHVDSAVELFVNGSDDPDALAQEINALNDKRRAIEEEIVAQIVQKLSQNSAELSNRVIVISGENWHHGIVGIVASRMVERFGKPCIVLSIEGEVARGSARSVEGFSIIDAINACAEHLMRYGGHNQAAGLTLQTDQIDAFTQQINEWAKMQHPQMPLQSLHIDCTLMPQMLDIDQILPMEMLEPFGSGNELPVFVINNCTIQGIYPIGDGKHLRLRFCADEMVFYAVYFGMAQERFAYAVGEVVDLAVTVDANEWNGEMRVSVKIKDIHLAGVDYHEIYQSEQLYQRVQRGERMQEIVQVIPDREDIAVVYRYLRAQKRSNAPDEVIYGRLQGKISSLCKVKIAIDVLEEMKLITRAKASRQLEVVENPARVNISDSNILKSLQS